MTERKYMNAIKRRLNMPNAVKDRVMSDLASSVASRKEAGQTEEEIFAVLGSPKQVSAELNEQMKEFTYQKSPWRWLCLGVAVLGGLLLLFDGVAGLLSWLLTRSVNEAQSVGIIGGADGPTAIFVTSAGGLEDGVIWLILTVMGLIGFRCLSRCKRK